MYLEVVKSETEVAKPETEVAKSETEVVKSETEVVKSETEVVKSETEVVKPETEVVKSETEVVKPETDFYFFYIFFYFSGCKFCIHNLICNKRRLQMEAVATTIRIPKEMIVDYNTISFEGLHLAKADFPTFARNVLNKEITKLKKEASLLKGQVSN